MLDIGYPDCSARAKNQVKPEPNTDPGSLELTPNKPHFLSKTTKPTYYKRNLYFYLYTPTQRQQVEFKKT